MLTAQFQCNLFCSKSPELGLSCDVEQPFLPGSLDEQRCVLNVLSVLVSSILQRGLTLNLLIWNVWTGPICFADEAFQAQDRKWLSTLSLPSKEDSELKSDQGSSISWSPTIAIGLAVCPPLWLLLLAPQTNTIQACLRHWSCVILAAHRMSPKSHSTTLAPDWDSSGRVSFIFS